MNQYNNIIREIKFSLDLYNIDFTFNKASGNFTINESSLTEKSLTQIIELMPKNIIFGIVDLDDSSFCYISKRGGLT